VPSAIRLLLDRRRGVVRQTFLCCDVVSFASLTERLGDRRCLDVMRRVIGSVRRLTARHRGRELELRGDCFLIAFATELAALRCGEAIQRALALERAIRPRDAVELRMSIHSGGVLREGKRFFGLSIVIAFRLLEQAQPGEILLSSEVRGRLDETRGLRFGEERSFRPKGLRRDIGFLGLQWSHDALGGRAERRARSAMEVATSAARGG
jgi:class 3 adenylate cyclase